VQRNALFIAIGLLISLLWPILGYSQSEESLKAQLETVQRQQGRNSNEAARVHISLGDLQKLQGNLARAEEHYIAAVLILNDQVHARHPLVLSLVDVMGKLQHSDQLTLLRLYAEVSEKHLGDADKQTASAQKNLADFYVASNRLEDAEQMYKRALVVADRAYGSESPSVVGVLDPLAELYRQQSRFAEALPLYRRALSVAEKTFGPQHVEAQHYRQLVALTNKEEISVATRREPDGGNGRRAYNEKDFADLDKKANVLLLDKKYAEAEPFLKQALDLLEDGFGPEHVISLRYRENVIRTMLFLGHYVEAESLCENALKNTEQRIGSIDSRLMGPIGQLANVYVVTARPKDAERLYQRALAISENNGAEQDIATALSNLGGLYAADGRYSEAESSVQRALSIKERLLGTTHPAIALSLSKLGNILWKRGRYAEAESLERRSLEIVTSQLGQENESVAARLYNLGAVLRDEGRFSEAAEMFERALAIYERIGVTTNPNAANVLSALAVVEVKLGKLKEAEQHLDRAYTINNKVGGKLQRANNLADFGLLYKLQGRLREAQVSYERALAMRDELGVGSDTGLASILSQLANLHLSAKRYQDALPLAQRAYEINRAYLISHEGGDNEERAYRRESMQDYVAVLSHIYNDTVVTKDGEYLGKAFEAAQLAYASLTGQDMARAAARFSAGKDDLAKTIRDRQDAANQLKAHKDTLLAALAKEEAQRNSAAEHRLREEISQLSSRLKGLDQLIGSQYPKYAELLGGAPLGADDAKRLLRPDEALLMYLLGEKESQLFIVTAGKVSIIRLDIGLPAVSSSVQILRQRLFQNTVDVRRLRPYDAQEAFALYDKIFAPAEPYLKDAKHVILVLDGPLQSLPFASLISELPTDRIRTPEDHRKLAWLVKRFSFSMLPSASSLNALRSSSKRVVGNQPFIGFGDPALDGQQGAPRGNRGVTMASLFGTRGGVADVDAIRQLEPLPDTAEELKLIAKSLEADEKSIYLKAQATEANVKMTDLSKTRVLAFSTHGSMAGELKGYAEPGLILTPPKVGTELDDGYLAASEIAQLKINAEWVLLSACNTAAANGQAGAEGLSGLARAFFYAGASSLLVSHWPVDSVATRHLMSNLFTDTDEQLVLGKAHALRQATLKVMNDSKTPQFAHPFYWAPFVVAGEGGIRGYGTKFH